MIHKLKLWLQSFRTYPPMLWILSIGSVINLTGMSFLWPLNTIYIHGVLGKSMALAGFILLLQQAAALIGNMTGGQMFDRWGGRITIAFGLASSMVVVAMMGIWQHFLVYSTFMVLLGFCFGIIFPAMNALASSVWPEGGRKAINLIYVSQNLGVAIGSALGGLLASYSFQWVFLGNSLTYALFLVLFLVVFKEDRLKKELTFAPAKPIVPAPGPAFLESLNISMLLL